MSLLELIPSRVTPFEDHTYTSFRYSSVRVYVVEVEVDVGVGVGDTVEAPGAPTMTYSRAVSRFESIEQE